MDSSTVTARLVVHDGDNSHTVAVDHLPFTIGRQADRDLVLSNAQISRQHAVIHHDDEGYVIQDLGSRHGIVVNGIRRETARLQAGDRIQLGASGITLVFLLPQDHSSTRALLSRISSTPSGGTELEKLSLFLQAAQSFNSTRVLTDVLTTMLEYTLRLTGAERGFVFLGDNASSLALESGLSSDGQPLVDDSRISHSILRDAATSGQPYIIGDVSGEGQIIGTQSAVAHELRSVIAIPLRGRNSDRFFGVLYLDSRLRTSTLNRVGRDILNAIASEAANLLENARMVQAERAADLLRNELDIAANIQQSLIARETPSFPYARILARTAQCTEVGGDFYDIIPLGPNGSATNANADDAGFVAIVADVSGKGMSAALLAAIIQGMMYAQVKGCTTLTDAFATVNTFLCSRVSGQKYVTMLAVHFRPNGELEFVNGGHVPPFLVLEDGTTQAISDGDVPVGLIPGTQFHSIRLTVPPKARLVLLSDGITETEDANGNQFGPTRLPRELASDDPMHAVFAAMHHFSNGAPPHDDCTLLVIDRTA
ncbi:SpoIIE family protein phosphatase [Edaphobacter aggregans]|uniref:SpoIIE family protein phosphatase n=1 Tax=Edaphobacter aggregans TaxID=570835 RepID=UPI000555A5CA|nr:SpoIIE family protein phosphatase [Edaphobacter aggregans]